MNGEAERELERKMRAYRRDALGFVGFFSLLGARHSDGASCRRRRRMSAIGVARSQP